jgi:hypothetical protein
MELEAHSHRSCLKCEFISYWDEYFPSCIGFFKKGDMLAADYVMLNQSSLMLAHNSNMRAAPHFS